VSQHPLVSATPAPLSGPQRDPVHGDRVQAEHHGDLAIGHLWVGFDELHNHRVRPLSVRTGDDLRLDHVCGLAQQCPVPFVHVSFLSLSKRQTVRKSATSNERSSARGAVFPIKTAKTDPSTT
jgi:hypothetical protein